MTASWWYFAFSVFGALWTLNAYRPVKRPPLHFVGYFASWLTIELVLHHLVWQVIATVVWIALGALEDWPGWVGVGFTVVSWIGLAGLVRIARRTGAAFRAAFEQSLGRGYLDRVERRLAVPEQPTPWRSLVLPFLFRRSDVTVGRNLVYRPDTAKRGLLDVYAPRGGCERAPVLMWVHGGAWTMGSKEQQGQALLFGQAAHGWVCVAPNYRLSPQATFPDHLIDVKAAIAWVREHIADYGGDPAFLAITGGSAGGHLAALAALTANDPEYQPGFEAADTSIQAAVPMYAAFDWTNSQGQWTYDGLIRLVERKVIKSSLDHDRDAWERASPLFRIHADAPPFLVVPGGHDSFIPLAEPRLFVKRLRATSRSAVTYVEVPGGQHAFEGFYSVRTIEAMREILVWLDVIYSDYLRAGGTPALPGAGAQSPATTHGRPPPSP